MLSRNPLLVGLTAALLSFTSISFGKTPSNATPSLYSSVTHAARGTATSIEAAFSPDDDGAEQLVLNVINSAKTSIRLAAYSFTSPKVVKALLAAKKRNVDVSVVVDDRGNRSKASQEALNLLVNASIPTRTISTYAIHHDKYMVIDSRHVETGSFNYSMAAAEKNSENVLVVWNNQDLASQYLEHWSNRFEQGVDYQSRY